MRTAGTGMQRELQPLKGNGGGGGGEREREREREREIATRE